VYHCKIPSAKNQDEISHFGYITFNFSYNKEYLMLQRLYVHNFRCLENFELNVKNVPSALLIGKNGVGKSTVAAALELFQKIGWGVNRVGDLVKLRDFSRGRANIPMRFEIEVLLEEKLYKYELALELPEGFKELRVREENLYFDGRILYSRKEAEVSLYRNLQSNQPTEFIVDWHIVALPIVQIQASFPQDPLRIFKTWLGGILILSPIPKLMTGESTGETLQPMRDGSNFGEWVSGLLSRYPAAYTRIDGYLHEVMPDIRDFQNEVIGKETKNTVIRFEYERTRLSIDFKHLSDGEKCFFLCAAVLAANHVYDEPLFCFWDEPDNYLSLSEVGHFIMDLRRSFKDKGQILVTSHNDEAIRRFSHENTFVLDRKSHLEPTLIKRLDEIQDLPSNLIDALICGDIHL
jgi:predicted ATPase